MEAIQLNRKLDARLEHLLDLFEKEVAPYDKISALFLLLTPIGVILSILIPLPVISYSFHVNPFEALVSGGLMIWIVGSVLSVLALTKLGILFLDHRKHEISR